jgi:hypothetical protein
MADGVLNSILFLYVYFIYLIIADSLDASSYYLLCKSCGHEIASIDDTFYMKSPQALQTWNDTLFHSSYYKNPANLTNKERRLYTTIQLLQNPHGSSFELITLKRATFLLLNNTKSLEDTWFPNFKWTIGVCPHCFNHLGWHFESILGEEGFFALILDQIINQKEAETIVLQPKLKMF